MRDDQQLDARNREKPTLRRVFVLGTALLGLALVACGDGDGSNRNNVNNNNAGICGDGHLDPGGECGEGTSNSDTAPNRCRKSCQLPTCGDGVTDDDYDEELRRREFRHQRSVQLPKRVREHLSGRPAQPPHGW